MITLDSIAGYKAEKAEAKKIIKLLQNYDKYESVGVYVPKGLVLSGPAGCGKTLFAKAIANEAGVPFVDFKVGEDATDSLANLKKAFAQAKKKTPSILYIDELDKLTSQRFLSSDAVRNLIQYLLTELDGISASVGVLVIASTNFYSDLPNALIRSGRMDKKIVISEPDLDSRVEILNYYIKSHKEFEKINTRALALKLNGMTGADIKTLVNNALIETIDSGKQLEFDDFVELVSQMRFEDIGRRWNNKDVVTKVLIHEAGHSIVNYALTGDVSAISGVQYGDMAGHTSLDADDDEWVDEVVIVSPEENGCFKTKDACLKSIAVCFGGMLAEKHFYGCYSNGDAGDVIDATKIFDRMMNFYFYDSRFIGLDAEHCQDWKTVHRFLNLRDRVFRKAKKTCAKIIKKNEHLIRYIVDEALKNEDALSSKQIKACLADYAKNKKTIDGKYKKETPVK